jgi:hypothetical protein
MYGVALRSSGHLFVHFECSGLWHDFSRVSFLLIAFWHFPLYLSTGSLHPLFLVAVWLACGTTPELAWCTLGFPGFVAIQVEVVETLVAHYGCSAFLVISLGWVCGRRMPGFFRLPS